MKEVPGAGQVAEVVLNGKLQVGFLYLAQSAIIHLKMKYNCTLQNIMYKPVQRGIAIFLFVPSEIA